MCNQDWPKRWYRYGKHRQSTTAQFQASHARKWSGQHGGSSQYDPVRYGTDQSIEQLEMDCVEQGIRIDGDVNVRRFYRHMGHVVGVCSGEFTEYVYAEWCVSGEIHGRPVSEKKLAKYGVTL
jgi:hypothetical protein